MAEETGYRVKRVSFGERRSVPILLQDVNGPCPLLAIANVLLLRGQLTLQGDVGEVTQERLTQLVAGHLLDSNSAEGRAHLNEEQQLNLQANLADAITRLPKLATGIDVNVRLHDIRGFEFTDEVAIFDLADISLVHGWLCDPQDEATAAAVGQASYNELVIQLVTTLGEAASPVYRTASLSPLASGPLRAAPAEGAAAAAGTIDAGTLSAALRSSLSLGQQPSGLSGLSSVPSAADSMQSAINHMMSDLVKTTFGGPAAKEDDVTSSLRPVQLLLAVEEAEPEPSARVELLVQGPGLVQEQGLSLRSAPPGQPPLPSRLGQPPALDPAAGSAGRLGELPRTPPPSAVSSCAAFDSLRSAVAPPAPLPPSAEAAERSEASAAPRQRAGEGAVHDALLVQAFLDSHPSQLTVYGLLRLHEGLADGQLACFFRNNHFSVLHKRAGELYLLVTDQGYLYEPDVVWERLSGVDGDTELVDGAFKPFRPHGAPAARAWDAAAQGAPVGGAVQPNEDADFALALRLQQEEEERAARARQPREQHAAARRQAGAASPSPQRRPAEAGAQPSGMKRLAQKAKSSDCSIM